MTDVHETTTPADGRVARRERNIEAVLQVVIEMYGEDLLVPTIEQASQRSGLSLRSLYRYFADPGELHEAAIRHHRKMTTDIAHLPHIGEGSLDSRIEDFVGMRVRLHQAAAPVFRASVHTAGRNAKVAKDLANARAELRQQFELQFATELAARTASQHLALLSAGDVLTQMDSIELFRQGHRLTIAETEAALQAALHALFA